MIDISKGRYWDLPWSLVDGCTPCSPGCDHCWSATMTHRFNQYPNNPLGELSGCLTNEHGKFNGYIKTHPERLNLPLKRKKPTVYAIWNDLFHEDVPRLMRIKAYSVMATCQEHTFLVLTKRQGEMAKFFADDRMQDAINEGMADYTHAGIEEWPLPNIYNGLTVCNQQEWDDKGKLFLQIPGKKFISHEPALERIDYGEELKQNACLIAGGELGAKARPSNPDIFQVDRDQCEVAGIDFFFKSWGSYWRDKGEDRILDGRTYDDLPWCGSECRHIRSGRFVCGLFRTGDMGFYGLEIT